MTKLNTTAGAAPALSTDINVITAEINAYQRVAGEAIFEIGRRLKHVKENDLAHGEFGKWLAEVGISERVAQQMMKVVSELSDSKTRTSSHLGMQAFYEIATMPPEARDAKHKLADGSVKTPDEMTVRELREVKKALKEAEAAAAESAETNQRLMDELTELSRNPKIEYVEVATEPAEALEKLRKYEERFGDVDIYEQSSYTLDNVTDISATVQTFNYEIRKLLKKYAFMAQYKQSAQSLADSVFSDYCETLDALGGFVEELRPRRTSGRMAEVININ